MDLAPGQKSKDRCCRGRLWGRDTVVSVACLRRGQLGARKWGWWPDAQYLETRWLWKGKDKACAVKGSEKTCRPQTTGTEKLGPGQV